MSVREIQVTFDCADPDALARFWASVLGYELQAAPAPFGSWEEALSAWGVPESEWNSRSAVVPPEGQSGPRLFFQRVPEPKATKNRVHLDVRAAPGAGPEARMDALAAEAERLVALGARVQRRVTSQEDPLSGGFIVMTDPEGNEFCLD
ncbi:MAG: VOC family protein [Nocardioides sp.]|uniref:VOC family protein n=1 Tax=Nocardioides sp. TaxID=35761 RepID=UPI003F0467A5